MNKRKKFSFGVFSLLAIFMYLSYIAVGQQQMLNAKSIEKTRIMQKIKDEEEINEELKKEHEMIDSIEYKERIARDKLGMVRRDERVFIDIGGR